MPTRPGSPRRFDVVDGWAFGGTRGRPGLHDLVHAHSRPVNSILFGQLHNSERQFPAVRVLGTIGWFVAGLLIGRLGWQQFHASRADVPDGRVRDILGLDALALMITLATYGIGQLAGSLISGPIVDAFVTDDGHLWARIRLIPAAIAVVVLIMLWVLFREQDAVPTGGAEPVEVDRSGSGV